ncbi:MAG: hypothetical protein M0P12_10530 [Paludibacteraceae bacterium]|nr:hypothetical protein [Paludibacteraceae bacterium]
MKKLELKSDQLFQVKILAKNRYRPMFYWDVDCLKTYSSEVVTLVVSLLRKRTISYFGLKHEGLDFDLEENSLEDYFNGLVVESNLRNASSLPNKGWNLFVNSLFNSVPNQPLTSWVGSDKDLLESVQSIWDDIFSKL